MTLQILIAILLAICWAHTGYQLLALARRRLAHLDDINRHQADVLCQFIYICGFMVCFAMALYAITGYPRMTWHEFWFPSPQQPQAACGENGAKQLHQAAAQRRAIQKTHNLVLHAGAEPLLPRVIDPLAETYQHAADRCQQQRALQTRVGNADNATHHGRAANHRERPVPVFRDPTSQLVHPLPSKHEPQHTAAMPQNGATA